MKILAEIDTQTHTVIELTVLQEILQNLQQIQAKLEKKNIDRVAVNMKEAARLLGCNYAHIKQLFHEGKLKGRQDGKGATIFIDYQSILDFIKTSPKKRKKGEEVPAHFEELPAPSDEELLDLHSRLANRHRA
ncbi:MAG: hypothetical protein ACPGJS_00765 [Flammeovirgaceae bacterium]